MRAIIGGRIHTMNAMHTWAQYIRQLRGQDTNAEMAAKIGTSPSAITRWLDGSAEPRLTQIVTVARAYGENPLGALVALGHITQDEASQFAGLPRGMQIQEFSDIELAQEIVRRIEANGQGPLTENAIPMDDKP